LLSLTHGPAEACADPFLDHGALELGEHTHHLKHGFACRRGGVESLLVKIEVDSQCMDFG
jgi:hypothetical protein